MTSTSRTLLLAALAVLSAACKRPDELPDMGLSRSSLSFEAPGGSGEPAAQTVYVTNTGRGSLAKPTVQIAYQGGSGWLAATVSGSGAPYGVAMQPRVGALGPGVYHATATLSCGNASSSPKQVDVTFTIPDPRFTLSTERLAFDAPRGGGDPATKAFQVLNAGRGTLPVPDVAISYVGASGWLSTTVTGTPDAYTVELSPHVAALDSGTYTATLSISAAAAEGPPRTLAVTLTVPPAELAVSTTQLRIDGPADGTDPAPIAVAVTNPGAGLLSPPTAVVSYAAGDAGAGWLTATVSGAEAPYTVTLQARQSQPTPAFTSGTHTATVTLSAPDASTPVTIAVALVVPLPRIGLSTPDGRGWVAFSNVRGCPRAPPQTVTIANAGAGWLPRPTVVDGDPSALTWLSAVVTGDAPPYALTLTVTAVPPSGTGWLRLVSDVPGVAAVPLQVAYSEPDPSPYGSSVSVSPSSLAVWQQAGAGEPAPQKLRVTTDGVCSPALDVEVGYVWGDPGWLLATSTALGPWEHEVAVTASVAGMAASTSRSGNVYVDVPGTYAGATVPISVVLSPFAATGSMVSSRTDETLTVLSDGRVLAAGGEYASGGTRRDTEIYDPSTRLWTAGPSMTKYRTGHGAVLLPDGDVLVCGAVVCPGCYGDASCERLHDGVWTQAPDLAVDRMNPALVPTDDGKVVVVSGAYYEGAEIYDPSAGSLATFPSVTGSRAVKLADGRVLVAGGTRRAWLYDPATGWSETGSMRYDLGGVALERLLDGRVLAVGYAGGGVADAELWDPAAGTWTPTAAPPQSFAWGHTARLPNGKVLMLSAYQGGAEIQLFDPATETWTVGATFPRGRQGTLAVRLPSGMILMTGGDVEPTYSSGTWTPDAQAFTW